MRLRPRTPARPDLDRPAPRTLGRRGGATAALLGLLLSASGCADREGGGPAAAPGPVSESELFEALDLSRPELGDVKAALDASDPAAARAALAGHLRHRPSPWVLDALDVPADGDVPREPSEGGDDSPEDANSEDVIAEAERVARGQVSIVGIAHAFEGGDVDWTANPTRARDDVPFNRQWGNHLNRTRFWRPLAEAYLATGDERFASAWVAQFRDFVADNPFDADADERRRPAWKTLVAASRMKNTWPDLLEVFRRSPSVADDDLVLFLRSCLEHGRHLRANHDEGLDNHLAVEMRGLLTVGCLFPEFREAPDWRRHALRTAARAVGGMFSPDGVSKELSPGYHKLSLDEFWRMRTLARTCGFGDEVEDGFVEALAPAVRAAVLLSTPERTLPPLNDSGSPDVRALLADKVGVFPDDEAVRWLVTDGAEGAPPRETSHFFPWAGLAVLRTGWGTDATYAVFDVGPLGTDHVHQDALQLVVWAHGRELLYDNGGGSYEESSWREYGADTHSHNTVLVDGLGQRRGRGRRDERESSAPIDASWRMDARGVVTVRGAYDGRYGDAPRAEPKPDGRRLATHVRRVAFLPERHLIVVVDDLIPVDLAEHHYEARWHLKSTTAVLDPTSGACRTKDEGRSNLAVVPLGADAPEVRVVRGQEEPELLGWDLGKRGEGATPTDTVIHALRGAGRRRFVTLLVADRPGEERAVEVEGAEGGRRTVRVAGGASLEIVVPEDLSGPIEVREAR